LRAGRPPPSSVSVAPNVMLGTTVPSTVHIDDMPRESSAGSGSRSRTARSGPDAAGNAATTPSVGDLPKADVISARSPATPGTSTPWTVAMTMGWIMGPATASVMGTVPEEKAGVASAMNDVTRQVGGALGTAVIGSLITSLYVSRVGDATAALPEAARAASEDSIGQANAVAATLPDSSNLADAASSAFTEAIGIGFTVAGAVAIVAALAVRRLLPTDRAISRIPAAEPAVA
jgi:hypothetical protein